MACLLFFFLAIVSVSSTNTNGTSSGPRIMKKDNISSPMSPSYPNPIDDTSFRCAITRAHSADAAGTPNTFQYTPKAFPETPPIPPMPNSFFSSNLGGQQMSPMHPTPPTSEQNLPINSVSVMIDGSINYNQESIDSIRRIIPIFELRLTDLLSQNTHKIWCSATETRLTTVQTNYNQLNVIISSSSLPNIKIFITSHTEIHHVIEYFERSRLSELTKLVQSAFDPLYSDQTLSIFIMNAGSGHMYKLFEYSARKGFVKQLLSPVVHALVPDEPPSTPSIVRQIQRMHKRRERSTRHNLTPLRYSHTDRSHSHHSTIPAEAVSPNLEPLPMSVSSFHDNRQAYNARIQLLILACVLAGVFLMSTVALLCVLCCCFSINKHDKQLLLAQASTKKDGCSIGNETPHLIGTTDSTHELYQQIQMLQALVQQKFTKDTAFHQPLQPQYQSSIHSSFGCHDSNLIRSSSTGGMPRNMMHAQSEEAIINTINTNDQRFSTYVPHSNNHDPGMVLSTPVQFDSVQFMEYLEYQRRNSGRKNIDYC